MKKTIKIQIQLKTLSEIGLWDKYCDQTGTNVYAISEGMDDTQWVTVDVEVEDINLL